MNLIIQFFLFSVSTVVFPPRFLPGMVEFSSGTVVDLVFRHCLLRDRSEGIDIFLVWISRYQT